MGGRRIPFSCATFCARWLIHTAMDRRPRGRRHDLSCIPYISLPCTFVNMTRRAKLKRPRVESFFLLFSLGQNWPAPPPSKISPSKITYTNPPSPDTHGTKTLLRSLHLFRTVPAPHREMGKMDMSCAPLLAVKNN